MKLLLFLLINVACIHGLTALSYEEWKTDQEAKWVARQVAGSKRELELMEEIEYSLEKLGEEPEHEWNKENALYSYNLLREMMKQSIVQSVEEIDQNWLNEELYRLDKARQEEQWAIENTKCKVPSGLPSIDAVKGLFPGVEETQGVHDVEEAYSLWREGAEAIGSPIGIIATILTGFTIGFIGSALLSGRQDTAIKCR
jgi:uncharacterized protein YxeA